VAVTALGRILSVVISLYTLLLIGLIPGIVVNYYMAYVKVKEEEALDNFLDKLENLENLSKEELCRISAGVKALERNKQA
jgi:voltage-gated potassium channel